MSDSIDARRKQRILVALIMGTLMAALDSSIVNISLPTIRRSMGVSLTEIEWVVTSYMITFAVVMPLTQWLKERWGSFRLYFFSLSLFLIGSLLCGLAGTLPFLVIARVIQGIGGGALTPTAMTILSTLYPPQERGRVIGIWGLGTVLGPAMGPTLGGILTQSLGWPSIFLVNLPLGAVGLYLTWKYLRGIDGVQKENHPFDLKGFVLLSFFLVSLLYGITRFENSLDDSSALYVFLPLSAISFVLFFLTERKTRFPLIELRIFSNLKFSACLVITFIRSAALMGGMFLLPFLLQSFLSYSEIQSGLMLLPGSLFVAALMPFSGRWADKRGPYGITLLGLVLLFFSMLGFAAICLSPSLGGILSAMAVRGVGLGLLITPLATATINAVSFQNVPLASSMSSLTQQVGGAVGVAVIAIFHELALQVGMTEQGALFISFLLSALLVGVALLPVRMALKKQDSQKG